MCALQSALYTKQYHLPLGLPTSKLQSSLLAGVVTYRRLSEHLEMYLLSAAM